MTDFAGGYLWLGEFATLGEAHVAASRAATASGDFRLFDVSMTARGAWLCGWGTAVPVAIHPAMHTVKIPPGSDVQAALFGLNPLPKGELANAIIVESERIAPVVHAVLAASSALIEFRLHRAGLPGATALFAAGAAETDRCREKIAGELAAATMTAHIHVAPLAGDYRRFVL